MVLFLAITLVVIFMVISIFHFYWAMGGEIGLKLSIPTTTSGQQVFQPKKITCAFVGFVFLLLSAFFIIKIGKQSSDNFFLRNGDLLVAAAFLLRAIGDYKYVGFSKRIKATQFGKWDTNLYSPLCLIVFVISLVLHFTISE